MLKPLDIVVGIAAHLWPEPDPWSFERLAGRLGIAASQAHTSLRRMDTAGLYRPSDRSLRVHAFLRFAVHGIPFAFPAAPGESALGIVTAHSAPPLAGLLVYDEPYVWPTGAGVRGASVIPLHPSVPAAAAEDAPLHAALALVDALRVGRARERQLAHHELEKVLAEPARDSAWARRRIAERSAS